MSILPICITGEPVLHRAAAPVESFDSELRDLVADMIETMHAAPGVGLAAPQVGVGSQVFVWRYGGAGSFDSHYRRVLQLDEGPARGFNTALHGVVVNPTLDLVWDDEGSGAILPAEPDMVRESEGCLSVPDIYDKVERPDRVRVRALNEKGETFELEADGLLAVCIQHEMDHLMGKVFVEYLSPLKQTRIRSKLKKHQRDLEHQR